MTLTNTTTKQPQRLLTAVAVSAALLLAACSDDKYAQEPELNEYIQQGQAYSQQHQYKAAILAAKGAIKAYPDDIEGYLILSDVFNQLGWIKQAQSSLEKYKGVKNSEYYFLLLDSYSKNNKFISAEKIISSQQVLLQQPDRLQLAQAKLLLRQSQLAQAETLFIRLQDSPKYQAQGMIGQARIVALRKDTDKAIALLDTVNELAPQNSESRILQSYLFLERGELVKAEASLTAALSVLPSTDIFTPERITILQSLSNILIQQGRGSEAQIYAQILADEFPEADAINQQYQQAYKLFKNKDIAAAKTELNAILQRAPDFKKAATLLGIILYNENDLQGSSQYLSGIIDPETDSKKLTQLYAMTQLKLNQAADVLALMENTIDAEKAPGTLALYAVAAIEQQAFEQAKLAIDRIRQLEPNSVRSILLLSRYFNSLPQPQYQQAVSLLEEAVQLHPGERTLLLAYIRQLLQLKEYTKADKIVAQIAKNNPNDIELVALAAQYYQYKQQFSHASELFNQILRQAPKHKVALLGLANIKQLQQDWNASLTVFNKYIQFYPTEILAYQGALLATLKLKIEPQQAPQHLAKNHDPAIIALVLSRYYFKQNELKLASEYLAKANTSLPSQFKPAATTLNQDIDYRRAYSALTAKDFRTAKAISSPYAEVTVAALPFWALLTGAEIGLGNYQNAQQAIEKIASLAPNSPLINNFRSDLALAQNNPEQAIIYLRQEWQNNQVEIIAKKLHQVLRKYDPQQADTFLDSWLQAIPQSVAANLKKAFNLQNNGNNQQALVHYETILKQLPNEITSLNNAAWLYHLIADPRAVTLAQKAYVLAPDNANILDTYGWILFKSGDQAQAKTIINKAFTLAPEDKTIQQHWQQVSAQ